MILNNCFYQIKIINKIETRRYIQETRFLLQKFPQNQDLNVRKFPISITIFFLQILSYFESYAILDLIARKRTNVKNWDER